MSTITRCDFCRSDIPPDTPHLQITVVEVLGEGQTQTLHACKGLGAATVGCDQRLRVGLRKIQDDARSVAGR